MSAPKRKKILFVCTGNTCRSPMAEMLLKERLKTLGLKGFSVSSAGTRAKRGDTIHPLALQTLAENGITVEEFHSRKVTDKLLLEAFVIVCMNAEQRDLLMELRWKAFKKVDGEATDNTVRSFSEFTGYEIFDPYGRGLAGYRYAYDLLNAGVNALVDKLDLRQYAYSPKPKTNAAKSPKHKEKTV